MSSKKTYIPIDASYVSFAGYSKFATNIDQDTEKSQIKHKHIILGSCDDDKPGFYEFLVDNDTNSSNYKSFKNDYDKKYANLQNIGLNNNVQEAYSYLVENNKYLLCIIMMTAITCIIWKMTNG